ncbi:MAG TPA: glutamine--tRNA ligase/YqeY domain fusion protein [Clostridia bacterium]
MTADDHVFEPVQAHAHFIEEAIAQDIAPGGRFEGHAVHTRFPPEPNGWLHIGHAKAFGIDFSMAERFGGLCNLRFDDTNPSNEDEEYVEAIQQDIRWMGYEWGDRLYFGSDYSEQIYEYAVKFIRKGLAYVDDLSVEQIRDYRGTLTEPGRESPWRTRGVEENLDLFARMRAGEFADGAKILRARIDMASGNMNLRDPAMYRIKRDPHHRTGTAWCIYPMYDFAHPLQDAIEGITHSLCSLEYEDHRPLYDWVTEHADLGCRPRQIEFSRLNMTYTIMSKRKLRLLVENGLVDGWDDPRMPTLSGMRRRGYTPASIRNFLDRIGVSKVPSTVDFAFLEHCVREDLNKSARRVMAVLRPVKLILENYPEDIAETFEADNNPENPAEGTRTIPFSRELWIEEDDFCENPPKGYFRLFPGSEVRLKHAYIIRCSGCIRRPDGSLEAVTATYDPATRGGNTPDGRKVKGTVHWVDAADCADAEVRLYDNLFTRPDPEADPEHEFLEHLSPVSLEILRNCKIEPSLSEIVAPANFQFLRLGYFCIDNKDSKPGQLVFNRSVSLKDSYKLGK